MAFTKQHKNKMVDQYRMWLKDSKAVILVQYKSMTMKNIDELRAKVRDSGAEMHVVKNTLFNLVLKEAGIAVPKEVMEGTTAAVFAFSDAPAAAKVFSELGRASEIFAVKGGIMENRPIRVEDVKALADLPPLPVMRARLLGVLQAPASQLVRTLAEPARSLAYVIKAYSEKDTAPSVA